MRRLVLLAMKKYARQQKNVIELAVREQGAKARLHVGLLHFGEELFATVGDAKHGYSGWRMRKVFRKRHRS